MPIEWGTVPAWITSGTAVVGTIFVLRQFRISIRALEISARSQEISAKSQEISAQSQANQVDIARANLLLAIDREFEGAELGRSRKAIRMLRNRIEREVLTKPDGNRSPALQKGKVARDFSRHLDTLWGALRSTDAASEPPAAGGLGHGDIHEYYELMALPNWIETVGALVARHLLPKEEVLTLYASSIQVTMFNFHNHVEARRNEQPYPNKRFMENAYLLYEEAIEYRKKKDEPLPDRPKKSGLPFG